MTNPIRLALVWWKLLTGVGDMVSIGRQIDKIFRFHVLEILGSLGVFDYLQEGRTYGQILAHFGFIDSDYTRLVFEVLTDEKEKLIVNNNGLYSRNPEAKMPTLQDALGGTPEHFRNFNMMAKGMAASVPQRLRNQPIELNTSFEQDGRQLMTKFDKTLSMRSYRAAREANFTFLSAAEQKWLYGKDLLEVGCGSGRETAEIWLRWKGNIRITAIDPVASLLDLAKASFADYLDEMNASHPTLTEANMPLFEQQSATRLPYSDRSFDAVYTGFVLHWTSDPSKAIAEIARVLKPGGLVFGAQPCKPVGNVYFDLVIRANENVHGYFWVEELKRWYTNRGIDVEVITPLVMYKGHKPVSRA